MLPDTCANGQPDLSVPGSTSGPGRRRGGSWEHGPVLRELRGGHGGPHLGTRALALVLALLLAAPLTVLVWRVLRYLLGTLL